MGRWGVVKARGFCRRAGRSRKHGQRGNIAGNVDLSVMGDMQQQPQQNSFTESEQHVLSTRANLADTAAQQQSCLVHCGMRGCGSM